MHEKNELNAPKGWLKKIVSAFQGSRKPPQPGPDYEALSRKVAKLMVDVSVLDAKVAAVEADLPQLNNKIAAVGNAIANLKANVAGLQQDIADLKAGMGDPKADQDKIDAIAARVGALHTGLDAAEDTLAADADLGASMGGST